METARQVAALGSLALLGAGGLSSLVTGNGGYLAAGICLVVFVVFFLIFTMDCDERSY